MFPCLVRPFLYCSREQIAAGANHVCAIGRRTRKGIRSGLASKGVWCAGNDGEEVTGIVEPRPENDP